MNLDSAEEELRQLIERRKDRYVFCVDVDGTLAEYQGWLGYENIGEPIQSVIKDLREAMSTKIWPYVIIHTCRVTTADNRVIPQAVAALKAWLDKNEVPHDEIWLGTGKPYANEYWDDKAVRKP